MSSTLTAIRALPAICNEIKALKTPANPALPEWLRIGYQVLKNGGSIRGFYGMGKSLIALLTAIAEAASGGKPIVIAAYRVLRAESNYELKYLAPSFFDAINILKEYKKCNLDTFIRWIVETTGTELRVDPKDVLDYMAKDLTKEKLKIEGKGFEKIISLIENNLKEYSLVVLDEFERIVERPDLYGYKGVDDIVEDFFYIADAKPTKLSFAIPTSLWSYFDIQIISRLQPSMQLLAKPEDMLTFLRNLLRIEELRVTWAEDIRKVGVQLRNPRAVIGLLLTAKSLGNMMSAIAERLVILAYSALSYPRPVKLKTRASLLVAYTTAWILQNIYAPFRRNDIERAKYVIISEKDVKVRLSEALGNKALEELETMDTTSIIERLRKRNLLRTAGGFYILTDKAINHLREMIRGEHAKSMAANLKLDPQLLEVELNLAP